MSTNNKYAKPATIRLHDIKGRDVRVISTKQLSPSDAARLAKDKCAFVRRFGITITAADWPAARR